MKRSTIKKAILFLLALPFWAYSQNTVFEYVHLANSSAAKDVVELADSSYVVLGVQTLGNSHLWHISSTGNLLNSYEYSINDCWLSHDALAVVEDGLLIVGSCEIEGTSYWYDRGFVLKIDSLFEQEWAFLGEDSSIFQGIAVQDSVFYTNRKEYGLGGRLQKRSTADGSFIAASNYLAPLYNTDQIELDAVGNPLVLYEGFAPFLRQYHQNTLDTLWIGGGFGNEGSGAVSIVEDKVQAVGSDGSPLHIMLLKEFNSATGQELNSVDISFEAFGDDSWSAPGMGVVAYPNRSFVVGNRTQTYGAIPNQFDTTRLTLTLLDGNLDSLNHQEYDFAYDYTQPEAVIGTYDGGCLVTGKTNQEEFSASMFVIKFDSLGNSTWVSEHPPLPSFSIYPNPVSEILLVPVSGLKEVYSLNGKRLLSTEEERIDLRFLAAGVYLLKANHQWQKFIKTD